MITQLEKEVNSMSNETYYSCNKKRNIYTK